MEDLAMGALLGATFAILYGSVTSVQGMDPVLRIALLIALTVWTILNIILIIQST